VTASKPAALEFRGVGHAYTRRRGEPLPAVQTVDLVVGDEEFIALVGPSGCGKSTLVRLAVGLLAPTAGLVRVFGHTAKVARQRHLSGIVFQDPALLEWRTALGNVALPGEMTGLGRRERQTRAAAALQAVGLAGFEGYFPRELSGGMRQRAAVARALTLGPRLLLLDEPLAALDQITRETLQHDLGRVWATSRVVCVLVTHSIEEAVFMSDRVVVLTQRPATVAGVVEVPAERPRSADFRVAGEYVAACRDVRALLAGDAAMTDGELLVRSDA
jgi:NitT/TauT family transport system ATP-binding protein